MTRVEGEGQSQLTLTAESTNFMLVVSTADVWWTSEGRGNKGDAVG